jgi:hypothetical protein
MRTIWLGLGPAAVLGLAAGWVAAADPAPAKDQPKPRGGLNIVIGSGNGVGNVIGVTNTGPGGVTVIANSRNGVGNRFQVENDGRLLVVTDDGMFLDTRLNYKGKDNPFWTKKEWSPALGRTVYWCPKEKGWFGYYPPENCYYPVDEVFSPVKP